MKENELREKVENILKLDFNDDDQTESILSLINKEVLKARIDELEELVVEFNDEEKEDFGMTHFFDEVTRKHAELRIKQIQSELNEVENERGEKNG